METTSMLLSRQIFLLYFLFCATGCSSALVASSVCPIRQDQPLRYVDVFDGEPADLAILVPDVSEERYGHWVLGYIYDAGRFVTIRCKYADKQTQDVKLTKRVEQCDYTINKKKTLQVMCG